MKRPLLKIYFDGGCRPNPGVMESAVVARGMLDHRPDIGQGTSERAEWHALLHALDVATAMGERDVLLLGDAVAVVNQASGAKCRSPELRERFNREVTRFDRVRVRHIKRAQNLAGIALGHARERSRIGSPAAKEPVS